MSPAPLAIRFAAHLDETGLLAGPALALLAVSGGADSLALLDLVWGEAGRRGLRLLVAHADHGIHPDSAGVAEQVVTTARERYGLETVVGQLRLGAGASETAAREARYGFLRRTQNERGAEWLATAHHADDQVETVLLRLLHGTAPSGLAGIPARGPLGLVRPLLPFRGNELAVHSRATGIPVFDDPANSDPRHFRSWLRTQLIPLIEQRLGERAMEGLLEVARHAALENMAWDEVLDALPGLDPSFPEGRFEVARQTLAGYHKPLAVRILRAAARRAGMRLGPAAAARAARLATGGTSGRRVELGEGLGAESAFDRLVVRQTRGEAAAGSEEVLLEGSNGETDFNGFHIAWTSEAAPERIARGGWTTWLEPGRLAVSSAARGGVLVPLRGVGRREVRRLLMEARVPRSERERYPLLTWKDEAVWLPGVCRGASAVPAPGQAALRVDVTAG